jgi:hypothetical protein
MAFGRVECEVIFFFFAADSQGEEGSTDDSHCSQDESSEVECLIEQTVPREKTSFEVLITKPKYGFGNQFSDVFKGFAVSFAKSISSSSFSMYVHLAVLGFCLVFINTNFESIRKINLW